ncbi:hypothetical protein E2C01_026412 [Portunus trituberculatus]|uniref:Uncharacterized protein n=1 Tax=Portunus trituberculatus TaxID=210409 RepID=A0A5B7EFV9_PORTR|nr:hypothetical protein [Portunus trituberculatus]
MTGNNTFRVKCRRNPIPGKVGVAAAAATRAGEAQGGHEAPWGPACGWGGEKSWRGTHPAGYNILRHITCRHKFLPCRSRCVRKRMAEDCLALRHGEASRGGHTLLMPLLTVT